MSTTDVPLKGSFRGVSDLGMVARQVWYEQLSFWLNPIAALLTIGFSVVFIVIFEATSGHSTSDYIPHFNLGQYYLPSFVAYGVMSACFNILAIAMVNRREMGLLKRLRLSPLPTWILVTAIFINSMIIALIQLVLLLLVGRIGYGIHGPDNVVAFVLVVVVGMLSFTAMAVGISTVVPNADAAGPIVSLAFFILLFVSGLYYPIQAGSGQATFADFFPIRHLITGCVNSFNAPPGTSSWPWNDLLVMAVWGLIGTFVAVRRWRWAPRRG